MGRRMTRSDTAIAKVPIWRLPIILYSYFGLSIALVQLLKHIGPAASGDPALRWPLAPQHVSMEGFGLIGTLVAVIMYAWADRGGFADRSLPFAKPELRYWLWTFAVLLASMVGYLLILFAQASWSTGVHVRSIYPYDHATLVLVVVVGVVIGPVCEEMLFRGFGMGYLIARGLNLWLAGGITMILFLLQHWPLIGLRGMLLLLPVSAFITLFRITSGNLTPGLMLHMLNNAVALLVIPILYVRPS